MPETTQTHQPVIVLGVTGSIAAYKACDITSQLTQAGIEVNVIMTESARELVGPRTFFTLSRRPVITSLWDDPDWQPRHIALAMRADLFVIAPATANIIGKLAHGIADDALSTYALAHTGPVLIAPAMNPRMWANAAVQENCRILSRRGIGFIGPDTGDVACGEGGAGRMSAPDEIVQAILASLSKRESK